MLTEPVGQVAATDPAGREIEHEALFFIHRGSDLDTVGPVAEGGRSEGAAGAKNPVSPVEMNPGRASQGGHGAAPCHNPVMEGRR